MDKGPHCLQASDHFFRVLLDNVPDVIMLLDADGTIEYINHALPEYSVESVTGRCVLDYLSAEDGAYFQRAIQAAFSKTQPQSLEISTAGPTYWRARLFPIKGDNGRVQSLLSISTNITEQTRAEQALRKERDRAQRYLDTVQVMLVGLDAQGCVSMINRKGCELLGYHESEIVGRNWFESFLPGPEGMEDVWPVFQNIMAGKLEGQTHYKNEIRTAQGRRRLIAWRNNYLKDEDGAVIGTISAGEDITEHAQIERSLQESEHLFRAMFENSTDGIAVIDLATLRVWDANQQLSTMLGYPRDELLQLSVPDFHPEQAWPEVSETFERFAKGEIVSASDVPIKHRDGHVFYADISRGAISLDGKDYIVGFFRDVTERRQSRQELQDSEARATALLQQNRRLTQRLFEAQEEERRFLAHELHDEFGQWLTALDAHAKVLGQKVAGRSDELHELSEAIIESTAQLYKGIRSMLKRLRPSTIAELGLAVSVRDLVQSWVSHHPEIQCQLSIDEGLGDIKEGLSITVYRIIQEALNNVARHADATEVAIQIERKREPSAISGILGIRIRDNGKGPAASLDKAGMGLANMRERVVTAGGQIEFGGGPGKGMRIDIRIPIPT